MVRGLVVRGPYGLGTMWFGDLVVRGPRAVDIMPAKFPTIYFSMAWSVAFL